MTDAITDDADALLRWRRRCHGTVEHCTGAMQRRMPHWVDAGSRVWADPARAHATVGSRRVDAIVDVAIAELRVRETIVHDLLARLLAQRDGAPLPIVLTDVSRMASQLLQAGCRDVLYDLEYMSRFERGVEVARAAAELAAAIGRVMISLMHTVDHDVD